EAAPRHVDQQFVTVAKMPVRRGRTHSRPSRSFRESKASRSFLGDQLQRRADQGLFQIAVVVAARTRTAALPGPAHVNGIYMTRHARSTSLWLAVGRSPSFTSALGRHLSPPVVRRRLRCTWPWRGHAIFVDRCRDHIDRRLNLHYSL